jgi:hypothetical protein
MIMNQSLGGGGKRKITYHKNKMMMIRPYQGKLNGINHCA